MTLNNIFKLLTTLQTPQKQYTFGYDIVHYKNKIKTKIKTKIMNESFSKGVIVKYENFFCSIFREL